MASIKTIPALGASLAFEAWRKQSVAMSDSGDVAEYVSKDKVRLSIKVDNGHKRYLLTIPSTVPGFTIEEV